MKSLFKQFNDKAGTKASNSKHLTRLKHYWGELEGINQIVTSLNRYKRYWIKIRVTRAAEMESIKLPRGLKKDNTLCLYVILNPNVSFKILAQLYAQSHILKIDFKLESPNLLKILCLIKT